ncbi:MAG: response regulator transcription factor [Anaerolineae bacterium]
MNMPFAPSNAESGTRVLLVDDHALFRQGLALILSAQPDFQVVGEAGNGLEAVAQAHSLQPDLILMDITMPECDGITATRLIKRAFGHMRVVMLTGRSETAVAFEALAAGAQGYVLKRSTSVEMLSLLRRVMRGEIVYDPSLTGEVLGETREPFLEAAACCPGLASLTPRELEVLQLLAEKATDQEIAQRLHVSRHTVKRHVSSVLSKLNVSNRREAARVALVSHRSVRYAAA